MTLDCAKSKNFFKIIRIKGGMRLHRRLLDMGFTAGTCLFVAAAAPGKSAILVAIRGVFIALRDSAAKAIEVEFLEGKAKKTEFLRHAVKGIIRGTKMGAANV